jgi:hypothetical protein
MQENTPIEVIMDLYRCIPEGPHAGGPLLALVPVSR